MPYCLLCKKNIKLGLNAHYYLKHDGVYVTE